MGKTVRLYKSVIPFFRYPSKLKRRNEQISWILVYNLYKANKHKFAMELDHTSMKFLESTMGCIGFDGVFWVVWDKTIGFDGVFWAWART